ncbi:hypothetical protein [Kitasatospora viridis]|uniref:hypothetical protein n=1 Tax=Kitasatospora viridis TaxID=281105 RepID=UPI0011A6B6C4|nr:hypothetical protein [Kitasatospora viridis]
MDDSRDRFAVYGPAAAVPEAPALRAWHTAVSIGDGLALVTTVRSHPSNTDALNRTYRPGEINWNGSPLRRLSAGGGSNGRVTESHELFELPPGDLPEAIELTVHTTDGTPHTTRLRRL